MGERTTYVLVDGENIDATLGTSILQRRPQPEERPRWDRLLEFCERTWDQPAAGLFFLAAGNDLPVPFVQALLAIGYKVIPLSGQSNEKVVDIAIQRTAEALLDRDADVVLVSHDGDFLPQFTALAQGERRVGVMAFTELVNSGFRNVPGLQIFDLEGDVGAFNVSLPRVRVIPIDQFNPYDFL